MPVRIYAFAKQLELDNKQLLDICEKVGIKGKGSALASLDDDEIEKIKSFMAGGDSNNGTPAPPVPSPSLQKPVPPPVPVRDKSPIRKGPLRDLDSIKKKNTEARAAADQEKKEAKKKSSGLVVNLVAMPDVVQPSTEEMQPTEKVQKPDIALPQDAIKKAREGSAAPLGQFTKKDKVKKKGKGAKFVVKLPDLEVLGEMPSTTRRGSKRKEKGETAGVAGRDVGQHAATKSSSQSTDRHGESADKFSTATHAWPLGTRREYGGSQKRRRGSAVAVHRPRVFRSDRRQRRQGLVDGPANG